MFTNNFYPIFQEIIMLHEGGSQDNSSDKHDKGGFTRYGISQFWKDKIDIANCTEREAYEFYDKYFYSRIETDYEGLNLFLFDSVIQHDRDACIWLQESLGFNGSQLDGIIGSGTRRAVANYIEDLYSEEKLIEKIAALRMQHYMDIKDEYAGRYHKGWSRRFVSVYRSSLSKAF